MINDKNNSNNEIKLKSSDLKLLAYLYHNAREPLTNIAKALHLSREQINYKIQKFENQGLIKGYIPLVNYAKFGYPYQVILLLKFTNNLLIQNFKKKHQQDKNRILHGELLSHYDFFMVLVFQNEKERNDYIFSLLQQHKEITDYLVLEPHYLENYPLKFVGISQKEPHLIIEYKKPTIKIDEKDIKILKMLTKNAKARIIDISKETGLSAELIVYKLKRLKQEKAFLGARAYFDMQKLGYFYTLIFLTFANFSNHIQERLKHFAKINSHVEILSFMLGKPNCYFQVFHKEENELRKVLEEIKEIFKEESFTSEIIPLKNEGEDVNALPFYD